ncbi:hypothetical protein [Treponema sp.]|uniref:hypothetical protein n=1 Tax=Treponema sp. TaxID=166 RepID=UPI003FA279D4
MPYKTIDNNPKKKTCAKSAAFFLGYICFCEYLSNKINGKNSTGLSKNFKPTGLFCKEMVYHIR